MSDSRARVDASGRIIIPARWREALGLAPGMEAVLRIEGDELRIMSRERALLRAQDVVRRHAQGESLTDLLTAMRRRETAGE